MTGQVALPELHRGDIDEDLLEDVIAAGCVAWDIETSGLDWRTDRIGTCQVATKRRVAVIKLDPHRAPERLRLLLELDGVRKVFHHAAFDLRFMAYQWNVRVSKVACTKIASKVLSPELPREAHSLKPLLYRHLEVSISKDEQCSDWTKSRLSEAQLAYAASDVRYLLPLLDVLTEKCRASGLAALLESSFRYLPSRVQLDLRGSADVFSY